VCFYFGHFEDLFLVLIERFRVESVNVMILKKRTSSRSLKEDLKCPLESILTLIASVWKQLSVMRLCLKPSSWFL
jgi:hypothetical protein